MFQIRSVDAGSVRPMRAHVLRPGQPHENLIYDGDNAPLAMHAAAFSGEEIVAIATVYPEAPPDHLRDAVPEEAYRPGASFRLRGMASHPQFRGQGAGRDVLGACLEHIRQAHAGYLWCNARIGAVPFYEAMRFIAVGEEFDIPGIGAHFVMWREA